MWNLSPLPPVALAEQWHDNVVSKRLLLATRTRLAALRGTVIARFGDYNAALVAGKLRIALRRRPAALSNQQRLDLRDNYGDTDQVDALKKALRTRLPNARQWTCPYCGIEHAGTWDHVAPKNTTDFPELSVNAQNLVPACGTCNGLRGKKWTETFLVWTDQLDGAGCCIAADLAGRGNDLVATYRFDWFPGAPASFRRRLRSHASRLGLMNRWSAAATDHLIELQLDIGSGVYGPSRAQVAAALAVRENNLVNRYNANHWKAVLYRAISRDPLLYNHLGIP